MFADGFLGRLQGNSKGGGFVMMFISGLITLKGLKTDAERYWNSLFTDIPDYIFQILLSLFCLGTVVFIILKGVRKGVVLTIRLLLIELILVINCSTVLFRKAGVERGYDFHPFWSYGAIEEGKVELLAENIMNVVVFVPIGLLMGIGFSKHPWWKAIGVGCFLSISIETMQLVLKRGFCEVDDVMHNTLGCMIGLVMVKGGRYLVKGLL